MQTFTAELFADESHSRSYYDKRNSLSVPVSIPSSPYGLPSSPGCMSSPGSSPGRSPARSPARSPVGSPGNVDLPHVPTNNNGFIEWKLVRNDVIIYLDIILIYIYIIFISFLLGVKINLCYSRMEPLQPLFFLLLLLIPTLPLLEVYQAALAFPVLLYLLFLTLKMTKLSFLIRGISSSF